MVCAALSARFFVVYQNPFIFTVSRMDCPTLDTNIFIDFHYITSFCCCWLGNHYIFIAPVNLLQTTFKSDNHVTSPHFHTLDNFKFFIACFHLGLCGHCFGFNDLHLIYLLGLLGPVPLLQIDNSKSPHRLARAF